VDTRREGLEDGKGVEGGPIWEAAQGWRMARTMLARHIADYGAAVGDGGARNSASGPRRVHPTREPFDASTTMGPLNNDGVAPKMDRPLRDAKERQATLLVGRERQPELGTPRYYRPSAPRNVPPESLLFRVASFGPVVPLTPVDDEEGALRASDGDPRGLVSAVFTGGMSRAVGARTGSTCGSSTPTAGATTGKSACRLAEVRARVRAWATGR